MSEEQHNSGQLVLVIEDDPQIRRFLRTTLPGNGYRIIEAMTALDGIRMLGLQHPDLVILDLSLPDVDGLDVTKQLREWSTTPIIVLSARDQEHDKILALDAGADDYLTKPFAIGELLARMRVALRHSLRETQGSEDPIFTLGDMRIDFSKRQVFVGENEIHLTPIEYKIMTILARYAGKVVTQRQLLKEVWGPNYTTENHYLRIYMSQLRHKLETDPARPHYLITEPGVGYRLKMD
jgi:two-component system, OmpR family, KDP operon response regulator KdpE